MVYCRSITPNNCTLNSCFTVCSSDRLKRGACGRRVHTSYRKRCRNTCDQVLETVASSGSAYSACMQARCKGARRTRGDRPRSAWHIQ